MALICVNTDCKYNDTHGPIMDSDLQYCPDCGSTLKRLRNSVLMQVQPAGRWRRFFGMLIDNVVMIPVIVLSAFFVPGQEIAALCFVLFLLFRDINGRSPGKLVTGTMVVGRAGSPSTTKQRLIRNLPFAVTMLPLFIPIIGYISYGLLDLMFLIESIIVLAGKTRIGDQMAGTIVVRRNTLPIRQARLNLEV